MQNVVAAFNSSIQFNKHNFWIDPMNKNQYFVGVQYPGEGHQVDRDAAGHPDHEPAARAQEGPVPLQNLVTLDASTVADARSRTTTSSRRSS